MAEKFGGRPSDYVDPEKEWSPYKRFCFDEAIFIRGVLEDNRVAEEYRQERGESEATAKSQSRQPLSMNATKSGVSLAGGMIGKIGVGNPALIARYVAAGGKWDPETD